MTLIKKNLPTDVDETNKRIDIWLKVAIVCIVGVILALWLASCNPVTKAYKGIAKYSPQSVQDTANFYKRAKTLIKEKPPITKPGTIKRVPYPVEKLIFDEAKAKHLTDSLSDLYIQDAADLVRDYQTSVKEASQKAFKEGYNQAKKELSEITFEEKTPDTIQVADPAIQLSLQNCEQQFRESEKARIETLSQRDIYKGQSKGRFWWVLGLIFLLLGSWALKIKNILTKPKLPIS